MICFNFAFLFFAFLGFPSYDLNFVLFSSGPGRNCSSTRGWAMEGRDYSITLEHDLVLSG